MAEKLKKILKFSACTLITYLWFTFGFLISLFLLVLVIAIKFKNDDIID
jgi:hypothetical protein